MGVTEGQIDQILSGITLGMSLDDMLILSGIDVEDIDLLKKNARFMSRCNQTEKNSTYNLLRNLHDVIDIQIEKGRDHAITWLLEKTSTRFSQDADNTEKPGVVNIFTETVNLEKTDSIEVYEGEGENG